MSAGEGAVRWGLCSSCEEDKQTTSDGFSLRNGPCAHVAIPQSGSAHQPYPPASSQASAPAAGTLALGPSGGLGDDKGGILPPSGLPSQHARLLADSSQRHADRYISFDSADYAPSCGLSWSNHSLPVSPHQSLVDDLENVFRVAIAEVNSRSARHISKYKKDLVALGASHTIFARLANRADKNADQALALAKQNSIQLKALTAALIDTDGRLQHSSPADADIGPVLQQLRAQLSASPQPPSPSVLAPAQPFVSPADGVSAPTVPSPPLPIRRLSGRPPVQRSVGAPGEIPLDDSESDSRSRAGPQGSQWFTVSKDSRIRFSSRKGNSFVLLLDTLGDGAAEGVVEGGGTVVVSQRADWDHPSVHAYLAEMDVPSRGSTSRCRSFVIPIHGRTSLLELAARSGSRGLSEQMPASKRLRSGHGQLSRRASTASTAVRDISSRTLSTPPAAVADGSPQSTFQPTAQPAAPPPIPAQILPQGVSPIFWCPERTWASSYPPTGACFASPSAASYMPLYGQPYPSPEFNSQLVSRLVDAVERLSADRGPRHDRVSDRYPRW